MILRYHGGNRTRAQRRRHELMAIESLAFDGKKKISRLNGSRIDGVARRNLLAIKVSGSFDEFCNPP